MSDADVVHHRFRQRHVPHVGDAAFLPRVETVLGVAAPIEPRHMPQEARRQMLVAFGGTVARRMRHADEGDVGVVRILVPGAAEEGRDVVPVPAAGLALHALIGLVVHHEGSLVVHLVLPPVVRCRGVRLLPRPASVSVPGRIMGRTAATGNWPAPLGRMHLAASTGGREHEHVTESMAGGRPDRCIGRGTHEQE